MILRTYERALRKALPRLVRIVRIERGAGFEPSDAVSRTPRLDAMGHSANRAREVSGGGYPVRAAKLMQRALTPPESGLLVTVHIQRPMFRQGQVIGARRCLSASVEVIASAKGELAGYAQYAITTLRPTDQARSASRMARTTSYSSAAYCRAGMTATSTPAT